MTRHRSDFKDTQLFDWDTEPILERPSTFFYADDFGPVRERPARKKKGGGFGVVLLACGLAIGTGFVILVEMAGVLHRLIT